ncbi:MAG TPA: M20 family metallopeptidase [Limnochordales bacterium]
MQAPGWQWRELVEVLRRHVDRDELVEMARELVRIDTSNPPGNEADAARWVQERMRALGFQEVQWVEPAPGRASVMGIFGRPGTGKTLLWNGHLDVVPPGEVSAWRYPPFGGVVDGGRLWGRGAADMKGGLAAILEAAAALRRSGLSLEGSLVVQAAADEEVLGDLGTRHLVERGLARADAAICGEPTHLRPLVAARGLVWMQLTAHGRSCHASTPHLGVNAVVKMSRVVQALAGLELPGLHPLLGPPTLCVSTIAGGHKTNVVPDRCTITVDRRLIPGETPEQAVSQVRELLAVLSREDSELKVELQVIQTAEPSEIDAGEPIVRSALRARQLLGLAHEAPGGMPGTTDARWLIGRAGIPTLILGPGELEQAHTVNESVSLQELEQAALLYALVLCDFVGVEPAGLA